MIRIPYIKIRQRNEVFFVTKFRSDVLLNYTDFHYREPYTKFQDSNDQTKTAEYIEKIKRQGINLQSNEEGIQRRLQYERIKNISEYLNTDETNFLPNSFLLSANLDEDDSFFDNYLKYENEEIGYFEFPDSIRFSIIDGQHRLAGISLMDSEFQTKMELTVILLFNVSIPTAAKLFSDINGKQKAVNKSLIYDLQDLIGREYQNEISKYHSICESFYTSKSSPLYKQIKMLGVGSGAISQAFFIDYTMENVNRIDDLKQSDIQSIYDQLFYFFKSFQKTFPDDWPVPLTFENDDELENYSIKVLKEKKSQLVKTNGFGAILRLFPDIYKKSEKDYKSYLEIIGKLKGQIKWTNDGTMGTGKGYQDKLLREMKKALNLE
jgi:DGQHR domain-containing protein